LKTKYNAEVDVYDVMLKAVSDNRHTCEEILKKRDLWAMTEEELEIND
jgi:hypothetical protein